MRVCVCIYYPELLICKRESGFMWAPVEKKKRKDFRESAFVFACVICGIFISCDLSFYHPTQFLSSTHKERRKPSHVGTVVLVDKNLHMTALQERSRMQQLPPGERRHLWVSRWQTWRNSHVVKQRKLPKNKNHQDKRGRCVFFSFILINDFLHAVLKTQTRFPSWALREL